MKCPIIKKCGGCFYPQDQYQEELKEIIYRKRNKENKIKNRCKTNSSFTIS